MWQRVFWKYLNSTDKSYYIFCTIVISTYVRKLHSSKKSAAGVSEVVDNQNVVLHYSLPLEVGAIVYTPTTATVDGVTVYLYNTKYENMCVLILDCSFLFPRFLLFTFTEQLYCFGF